MQDVKYLKDQKYKRTKKGLVTKIYALQKSHSKKRGHSFPVYSKNDLKTWLYSQPTFHLIYSNWVANNYAKDLTPSCDRLSNKLGYSLDNLQVITWLENKKLGEKDMREGNLPNCRTPYRPDVVSDESAYNSGIKVEFEKVADYTKENHRDYNVGSSNYAAMKIQPWDVWRAWALNPWDADIVKRIARTKNIPGTSIQEARIEDYEKIIHNCKERISQLKEEINVK